VTSNTASKSVRVDVIIYHFVGIPGKRPLGGRKSTGVKNDGLPDVLEEIDVHGVRVGFVGRKVKHVQPR